MNFLVLSVIIAVLLIMAAIFSLSLGWLITGRSKWGTSERGSSKKMDDKNSDE